MFFVLVHGFAEWTGVVMKITEREISLRVSPKQKFSTVSLTVTNDCRVSQDNTVEKHFNKSQNMHGLCFVTT